MKRIGSFLLTLTIVTAVAQVAAAAESTAEDIRIFQETKAKAEAGDVDSFYKVGSLYGKGLGVEKNVDEAAKWYHKAAEQNDPRGQSMLGVIYTNAKGVPKDYVVAMKWFNKAAAQNSAHAQYNLGYMYATGKAGVKDLAQSAEWYRKAALQNERNSQRILGGLYAAGRGVPKDLVQAYAWTNLNQSTPEAQQQLAKLKDEMTPEQIAAGDKLTAELQQMLAKPSK